MKKEIVKNKTVVLGVTGGIAVYKALDIASMFRKKDINVHVIMTENATKFVTPLTFQSISQNLVTVDMFTEPKAWEIQHISLAHKADVMLIAPATANIIGKVANGIADDMLSTTIMATKAKVIFAPAMNNKQRASSVAVLGGILCEQGKAEEAQKHKPDYLRLSQAEREFQQKQRDFRI